MSKDEDRRDGTAERRITSSLHADGKRRCAWCPADSPLYVDYHDNEWGVPLHDDQRLFEMLCLEGAQAGLSWLTILRKREGYRAAFDDFDAEKMVGYGKRKRGELLLNPGIVRNRLKVDAFISNADEEGRLATADYRQKLADAILNAVRAYKAGK